MGLRVPVRECVELCVAVRVRVGDRLRRSEGE